LFRDGQQVARCAYHEKSRQIWDHLLEKTDTLAGNSLLAANRIHDVAGGCPARPHIILSEPYRYRISCNAGKNKGEFGKQGMHRLCGVGCCDENLRLQRSQLLGERRQAFEVAVGVAHGKDVIRIFDQPCIP
jgi:hypothetical protein